MVVGCQPYTPAAFIAREHYWYSFLLEVELTPGPQCDRKDFMSMKNPLTPAGIEPATFRFVAQNFPTFNSTQYNTHLEQYKLIILQLSVATSSKLVYYINVNHSAHLPHIWRSCTRKWQTVIVREVSTLCNMQSIWHISFSLLNAHFET